MLKILFDFFWPLSDKDFNTEVWKQEYPYLLNNLFSVKEEEEILRQRNINWLDSILAATHYRSSPLIKKAIYHFKYHQGSWLAADLAHLIAKATGDIKTGEEVVLCPVPLHWGRQMARGFNQSCLLAERIAAELGLPTRQLLKRTRSTGHQAWRNREQRISAVKNAFKCKCKAPGRVILIDDVTTTGSTLDACAKALKEAGASRVDAWVIAHDPLIVKTEGLDV